MTDKNNAAQPVLTDDELKSSSPYRWLERRSTAEVAERMLRHFELIVLSKLRAPVALQACPTDVCQAAQADGVLCANDECDRASGVRSASAPVPVRLPPRESENCGSSSAIAYAMAYNKALDDVAALNASAPVAAPVWNDDYKHDASMFQPRAGMQPLEPEFAKVLSDNFDSLMVRAPVSGDGKTRVPGDHLGGPAVAWDDGAQSDPNQPESRASIESKGGALAPVAGEAKISEDDALDILSEHGDHNVEHGRIMFDKWTLRAAGVDLMQRCRNAASPANNQGWSGWACQYPGKLPRLYGARELAELNCDPGNGDRMLLLSENAAPQASEAVRWVVTDDMRAAVRFAPSSAHWSERLKEFFGPDAREGINALEKQLREARANLDRQQRASETVRDALMAFDEAMSLCDDYPELQHHRDALLFAVQRARAALSAQPGAQRTGGSDAE